MDNLSTRSHKLLVITPRIAPVGGTIFDVKSTLQLQESLCNELIFVVAVESGPESQLNHRGR